ncbi:N-acetyltransferase [Sphingomonas sp. JC676]|uniref:GNAT family N-acetyltransferase n=1 Tax=Sphingomonas sp. JC676 TaxID=2768065 RepID=UPI0016578DD2|nr:GNAT family N-acetyltransferase [Sphingomonas sp. JC676]MBC9030827.1 N-acetyltransferase [Sphingomonas sp. JC676]
MPNDDVRNNIAANRYELDTEQGTAFSDYQRRDGAITFTHTVVPKALQGRGIASRLIAGALADVRAKHLKVVPLCEFVAAYIQRHPEEQDLLAARTSG